MERFEKVLNSLKELDRLGVENVILGEIEINVEKAVERVRRQRELDINRIRLFAIHRGFDFMAHTNIVKVFNQAGHSFIATAECTFVANVDVSAKTVSIQGDCPFSEEEILQGMTRMEFGEKYGHNHELLLRPHNEDFFVRDYEIFYRNAR
jgi:hypothetical protein